MGGAGFFGSDDAGAGVAGVLPGVAAGAAAGARAGVPCCAGGAAAGAGLASFASSQTSPTGLSGVSPAAFFTTSSFALAALAWLSFMLI